MDEGTAVNLETTFIDDGTAVSSGVGAYTDKEWTRRKDRRMRCIEAAVSLVTHDYAAGDSEASVKDSANMVLSVADDFYSFVENG